jgi:hypothetical protein
VDSGPLTVLGIALPIRMTVVRLAAGDLWLHSPTRCTRELSDRLERHGRVRYLIAPNIAHWLFLREWQRNHPDAVTFAAPGLRERRQMRGSGVRIDYVLSNEAPLPWAGEIEQVVVRGLGFSEVDFYHRPSRTLVITDLVQNLETEYMPALARTFARVNGVAAPNGRTPVYLRLLLRANGQEAAQSAAQLVRWGPERVIFSHGRWYDRNGTEALRRSLDWLLPAR